MAGELLFKAHGGQATKESAQAHASLPPARPQGKSALRGDESHPGDVEQDLPMNRLTHRELQRDRPGRRHAGKPHGG